MAELVVGLPEEHVAGTFASGVRVSHSRHAFILDFLVHDDRYPSDEESQRMLIVDRVRLDPHATEQLLTILAQQVDRYTQTYGEPDA